MQLKLKIRCLEIKRAQIMVYPLKKRFHERQGHCQQKSIYSVTIDINHAFI